VASSHIRIAMLATVFSAMMLSSVVNS